MKLNFDTFMNTMKEKIQDFYGDKCRVERSKIQKNNGAVYHGLTIMEEKSNVYPTIYLDDLYRDYLSGEEIASLVTRVIHRYDERRLHERMDGSVFLDYEQMKDRVAFKLIHRDRNQSLLQELPHDTYLDLALVYYCRLMGEEFKNMTITINHRMLSAWGITFEELKRQAIRNASRILPPQITDMRQILEETGEGKEEGDGIERMEGTTGEDSDSYMYVLTNREKYLGAACILYPDLLRDFRAALGCDYFVLPSSIHEVILVPADKAGDAAPLQHMVRDINRTQVEAEEVLSDSVYFYAGEKEELLICEEDFVWENQAM